MVDKLAEMGEAFSSISKAVKTVKSLHQKNGELGVIIEKTKMQADNIEDLQIPDEPSLLGDLKRTVRKVREFGSKLETWLLDIFIKETSTFEKFVRINIKGSHIPSESMDQFCDHLERMHNFATGFSDAFEKFVTHLSEAQEMATKLMSKLVEKGNEKQKQASGTRNKGAAGTIGLAASGVGLVALGFFTGGLTWAAAGVVAGATCGAGAAGVGALTSSKVKEMRALGGGILANANTMGDIAKNLKAISDRAGDIPLDGEAIDVLKAELQYFRDGEKKGERMAELSAKDAQIEELKAEVQRLRASNQH